MSLIKFEINLSLMNNLLEFELQIIANSMSNREEVVYSVMVILGQSSVLQHVDNR